MTASEVATEKKTVHLSTRSGSVVTSWSDPALCVTDMKNHEPFSVNMESACVMELCSLPMFYIE